MTPPLIRPAAPGERERMREILGAAGRFSDEELAWASRLIDDAFTSGTARVRVAVAGERIIGWAGWQPLRDLPRTAELCWIAVEQEERGNGVGTSLVGYCEAEAGDTGARWMLIETTPTTAGGARVFYEKLGYQEISRIVDFSRTAEDRLVMIRPLGV